MEENSARIVNVVFDSLQFSSVTITITITITVTITITITITIALQIPDQLSHLQPALLSLGAFRFSFRALSPSLPQHHAWVEVFKINFFPLTTPRDTTIVLLTLVSSIVGYLIETFSTQVSLSLA